MRANALLRRLPLPVLVLLAGCSGSSSSPTPSDFEVDSINVLEGQEWRINRPIEVRFNKDVDFATVNANTIHLVDETGLPATGVFSQPPRAGGGVNGRVVRFQPTCPTREDFADAGLQPFRKYQLSVLGSKVGGVTVRSTDGDVLELGALVTFPTPKTTDPLALFLDTVPGPPAVRLRGLNAALDDEATTYLEIGGQRVYFQLDEDNHGSLPAETLAPLNHYSIPENRVSVVVHLNQPVSASADNLSPSKIGFEYAQGEDWLPMLSDVEFLANCTETGSALRVSPRGLLPQDRAVRVVLRAGFRDLTGDETKSASNRFARLFTAPADGVNPLFPGVTNPEVDEVLEAFDLSAGELRSLEDRTAGFETPRADWGGGKLQAAFAFGGTGGPEGTFDWFLEKGVDVVLNTSIDQISGGPDGNLEHVVTVVNGVVDIRRLKIPESSRLILIGPNPCTILATGDVEILGEISIRGGNAPGVQTLNTTFQPEQGAKGQGGGGDGGTGSFLTNQSTPRGGHADGALGALGAGGRGGETSYFQSNDDDQRRGAGGGGGRFGADVVYDHDDEASTELVRCQTLIGLDVERGAAGAATALGAISQSKRAAGGEPGPLPFFDESADNDFYGVRLSAAGVLTAGELDQIHAGAGGGAGGDAVNSNSFPLVPWDQGGDEKGAGGGGGGGGIQILALGAIVVGNDVFSGSIAADGGDGGAGENPFSGGFDRVGGGSGGGSGGHIVLSSATKITVYGQAEDAGAWYRDPDETIKHFPRVISAVGGQGGAGNENKGGANETGAIPWWCDRIPFDHFQEMLDVPPHGLVCYATVLPDLNDPEGGPVVGAGGDGGPGLIQFHVQDPALQLEFPTLQAEQRMTYAEGLDVTGACAPPPVGWRAPGEIPDRMIPFFGKESQARSKWIPLGLARISPEGIDQVLLRFGGTDAEGVVRHDGDLVEHLDPLLGPEQLGELGSPPYIDTDGRSVVFDASDLGPTEQLYRANPALLRGATVLLGDDADEDNFRHFTVAVATLDTATDRLVCRVDAAGPAPEDFIAAGAVLASLVPHFARVVTSNVADSYPENTAVRILFDATTGDEVGQPDEDAAHGFAADIGVLNQDTWDFVRFEVGFDLDVENHGLTTDTPRPGLDHLRISFEF